MRAAARLSGNLLILTSLAGLVVLAIILNSPQPGTSEATVGLPLRAWLSALPGGIFRGAQPASSRPSTTDSVSTLSSGRAITSIVIPSIDLSVEVVEANIVPKESGYTWEVPAFKVGHAASTAGAGEMGNAVLLGHVTSLHSGNVFQELDKVKVGDAVHVFSNDVEFDYQVVSTRAVPRTDSSVLQPSPTPTVSLITCTGVWLPTIWDYTERLVVQAELAQ